MQSTNSLLKPLFEDENIFVIEKPSGMPSHRLKNAKDERLSTVDFFLDKVPSARGVGFSEIESGLVHRLDTGTSGLLLFAKSKAAWTSLRLEFQEKRVIKKYTAYIYKTPSIDLPSLIRFPIGHSAKSKKKMLVIDKAMKERQVRGKIFEAETMVLSDMALNPESLAKFAANNPEMISMGVAFDIKRIHKVLIQIKTGVMHQIRAHLASVQCPIVGDDVYGGPSARRLYLHSTYLEIALHHHIYKFESIDASML